MQSAQAILDEAMAQVPPARKVARTRGNGQTA